MVWFSSRLSTGGGGIRMSIVFKSGVRAHTPYLPFPPVFEKGEDFRNFLLAKCNNPPPPTE